MYKELGADRPDEFLEYPKYFLKVTFGSTLNKGESYDVQRNVGYYYELCISISTTAEKTAWKVWWIFVLFFRISVIKLLGHSSHSSSVRLDSLIGFQSMSFTGFVTHGPWVILYDSYSILHIHYWIKVHTIGLIRLRMSHISWVMKPSFGIVRHLTDPFLFPFMDHHCISLNVFFHLPPPTDQFSNQMFEMFARSMFAYLCCWHVRTFLQKKIEKRKSLVLCLICIKSIVE